MIEIPIDGFELAGAFVLVGQGIIDKKVERFGTTVVVLLEVVEEQFEKMDA